MMMMMILFQYPSAFLSACRVRAGPVGGQYGAFYNTLDAFAFHDLAASPLPRTGPGKFHEFFRSPECRGTTPERESEAIPLF